MGVRPCLAKEIRQSRPSLGAVRAAGDDDVVDEPAREPATPGPDRDFDAILLDVCARREKQAAARHRADAPWLATLVEPLPVRRFAGLDPGFAEDAVLEAAFGFVARLRGFPHPGDVSP
jgi:hypothetical protein